ncbi:unnamed protein product [Callosobruchus maculatus]|uniref:EB domain-containing protein n=1 Tax=Callosobruchus maculatus TaxID=64391 RepID=A0A653CGS6_CALMS|nr:unnamed protein product [Callosobruchus maculatus]
MLIVNAICIRSEIVECFSKKIFGHPTKAHELGDECNSDWECKEGISGAICQRGRCTCQPFFARVNQTTCLHDPPGLRLPRSGPVFPESGEQQLPGRRMSMCRWLPAVQETYLPWTC